MEVALIGLSQSGKSTMFAAVTEGKVHADTGVSHQVDKANVKVPDERVDKLSAIYKPKKTTYATIDFLDLPGLNFDSESGRQEARRIVAQARQSAMLVVVVRNFHNDSVAAYRNRIDPVKDWDELKNELLLADLEMITNRIDKLKVAITKPTPQVEQQKRELALMEHCSEALENLGSVRDVIQSEEEEKLVRSFGFLTMKPMLLVINVDEDKLQKPMPLDREQVGLDVIGLSAKLEAELAVLDAEERKEFMADLGMQESAKDLLLRECYTSMNLISFLTYGPTDVRAWTIPAGCPAVEAAGEIHSDIQRGFIRAETTHWEDFVVAGDMKAAKAAGKVRLEGKMYVVQDGDIITFRFNV